MECKTIEIFYDVLSIPGIKSTGMSTAALDFRNAAMDLIESALESAGVGEWLGAEIGSDEVNFGFQVTDFEAAEAIVRKTVAGTPYENIREITRTEFEESDDSSQESDWDEVDEDSLEGEDEEDELDRAALAEGLSEMGFEDSELLASLAQMCQRLMPTDQVEPENRSDEETSHLGGVPDVPPDFEWPRYNGQPLAFIAQVDYFTEGMLWLFFYEMASLPNGRSPDHYGSCRVLMVPRDKVSPATMPADLPANCRFPHVAVTVVNDVNLPDYSSQILRSNGVCENDLIRLKELDKEGSYSNGPAHHLLGYPSLLDGDMEWVCQLASNGIDVDQPNQLLDPQVETLKADGEDWILLFQCDADPSPGWTFGNSGRLYFWLKPDDDGSWDFGNVWAIVQNEPQN